MCQKCKIYAQAGYTVLAFEDAFESLPKLATIGFDNIPAGGKRPMK